jgi:methylmalonyl-CoA mutase N-terminal domain/subunit
MKIRYKATDERSMVLRFHAQTAGSTLTAQQPENNVVRVAVQALAAILGGTQSLHTNARDEALALPTESSAKLALRTQQILAHESKLAKWADPLGGSWLVESLTNDLEEEALAYLEEIRSAGGVLMALESGYIQKEIQNSAYQQHRRFENGEEVVVGINQFAEEGESGLETLQMDEGLESRQIGRLRQFKQTRDLRVSERALDQVRRSAETEGNLVPVIVEAVKANATVGEISAALGDVFGFHQETIVI